MDFGHSADSWRSTSSMCRRTIQNQLLLLSFTRGQALKGRREETKLIWHIAAIFIEYRSLMIRRKVNGVNCKLRVHKLV